MEFLLELCWSLWEHYKFELSLWGSHLSDTRAEINLQEACNNQVFCSAHSLLDTLEAKHHVHHQTLAVKPSGMKSSPDLK